MDYQSRINQLFTDSFTSSNRGMLHAARAAIGSLPMITLALLSKATRPIRIIVDRYATTGSTDCENEIRLPPVPMPKSDDDVDAFILIVAIYYGLIHHEVGHCNRTDISVYRSSRRGLERFLLNLVDDVWQEREHIKQLPSSRAYLDALNMAMAINGKWGTIPSPGDHPANVFTCYIGTRANAIYRQEPVTSESLAAVREVHEAVFGTELTDQVDAILAKIPTLQSTRDGLSLSRELIALLQQEAESPNAQAEPSNDKSNPQEPSQDSESSEASSQGSGSEETSEQSDASEDSEAGQGDDEEGKDSDSSDTSSQGSGTEESSEQSDASEDSEAGQGDDEEGKDSDSSDTSSQGSGTEETSEQSDASEDSEAGQSDGTSAQAEPPSDKPQGTLRDRINAVLSTTDDAGSDKHDAANEMLGQLLQQISSLIHERLDLEQAIRDLEQLEDPESTGELQLGADHDLDTAYSIAMHLRRRMLSELDTLTNTDVEIRHRGRHLSSRHLHRVIAGDGRVFRRVSDGMAPSTAVMLVQDVSGSMDGEPVRIASQALYASAAALEGIDGIEVAAMAFPGNGIVIDFGQAVRPNQDRFQLASWGGTPMGEAINVALHALLLQPQERKIMIVLTDGWPNNRVLAETNIATAEAHGVEVFGVGICCDSVQQLFSRSAVIHDVAELPEQLVALVRDEVMSSLAA